MEPGAGACDALIILKEELEWGGGVRDTNKKKKSFSFAIIRDGYLYLLNDRSIIC